MEESHKIVRLMESIELGDKQIFDLEVEHELPMKEYKEARAEIYKAWDEVRTAKDKVEDAKLELQQICKKYEAKLVKAKDWARKEFKTSKECDLLKVEYAFGAYLHGFKEAQAFLRSNFPNIRADNQKTVLKIANSLELSESEDTAIEDEDDYDIEVNVITSRSRS